MSLFSKKSQEIAAENKTLRGAVVALLGLPSESALSDALSGENFDAAAARDQLVASAVQSVIKDIFGDAFSGQEATAENAKAILVGINESLSAATIRAEAFAGALKDQGIKPASEKPEDIISALKQRVSTLSAENVATLGLASDAQPEADVPASATDPAEGTPESIAQKLATVGTDGLERRRLTQAYKASIRN